MGVQARLGVLRSYVNREAHEAREYIHEINPRPLTFTLKLHAILSNVGTKYQAPSNNM